MSSSRNKIHIQRITAPPWYISVAWLLLALLAQACVMHYLVIRNVEANLVLVAVIWYAIRTEPWQAAAYGCAGGFIEDLLSYRTGGAWTISTTAVALVVSMISRGFFADSIPLLATITFAATLLCRLIFWVTMGFEGYPSGLGMIHFHEALIEASFNAILMMVVMILARRFGSSYA